MKDNVTSEPGAQLRRLLDLVSTGVADARRDGDTAVIWVFRDYHDHWCVRKEGGDLEVSFPRREDALKLARATGRAWGSYRLFLELRDGRVTQEVCNPGRRSSLLPG